MKALHDFQKCLVVKVMLIASSHSALIQQISCTDMVIQTTKNLSMKRIDLTRVSVEIVSLMAYLLCAGVRLQNSVIYYILVALVLCN